MAKWMRVGCFGLEIDELTSVQGAIDEHRRAYDGMSIIKNEIWMGFYGPLERSPFSLMDKSFNVCNMFFACTIDFNDTQAAKK